MSQQEARYQSLAASCAAVIAFLGLVHEVAGPLVFPWALAVFGAPLWHGIGIFAVVLGVALVAGIVGAISFPIVPCALAASVGGIAAFAFMMLYHGDFHFFALCLTLLGIGTAVFERKAQRLRAGRPSP